MREGKKEEKLKQIKRERMFFCVWVCACYVKVREQKECQRNKLYSSSGWIKNTLFRIAKGISVDLIAWEFSVFLKFILILSNTRKKKCNFYRL